MSQGAARPWGHQGSVDGDDTGGPTPPPSADFLSTIYAAGRADNPAVDNTMVGSYFSAFFDFDDNGLTIDQVPATSGVDSNAHPGITVRRHFSAFPTPGLVASWEMHTDLFPLGLRGAFERWVYIDSFNNRTIFATEHTETQETQLSVPGYSPARIASVIWSDRKLSMVNERGGGDASNTSWNSDGGSFRRCLLPDSGGPYYYMANQFAMQGTPGNAAQDGSSVALAALTGPATDFGDNLEIASIRGYQDAQNYGSGQVAGHIDVWARGPALGGALTRSASFWADRFSVPGAVLAGLDVDPVGGVKVYAHDSANASRFVMACENDDNGANAKTFITLATGLSGSFPLIQLNSHNAAGASLTDGPENFSIYHQPSTGTAGRMTMGNFGLTAGADFVFVVGAVEAFRLQQADKRLKFAATSFTANGAQAVTIGSTGPAAIATPGAPSKWFTFRDSAGVLTYIPAWQ
jgi:hypothetical protein